jgi:hypothetical protein
VVPEEQAEEEKLGGCMRAMVFAAALVLAFMGMCRGAEVSEEFLDALTITESSASARADAVGDRELFHKAYGPLQIRQPYLDDVNRVASKAVRETWGKRALTTEDMKDPEKARWAARVYLGHYGRAYERETGRAPTDQVYARMHNGGPRGWERSSTRAYWAKASAMLRTVRGMLAALAKGEKGEEDG